MILKTVRLDKLFSTSSYLNDRAGIEAELSVGEDPIAALMELTKIAIEFNKQEYPELYKFNDKPMTAAEVDMVISIGQCQSVQKLSRFKGSLNDLTKKYYDDKVKEFSSKQSNPPIDLP